MVLHWVWVSRGARGAQGQGAFLAAGPPVHSAMERDNAVTGEAFTHDTDSPWRHPKRWLKQYGLTSGSITQSRSTGAGQGLNGLRCGKQAAGQIHPQSPLHPAVGARRSMYAS